MFSIVSAGVLIGIANIIPGISGATVAVITNQYERIMTNGNQLTSGQFKSVEWGYLIGITLSAITGIYVLSWPLDFGLTHFEGGVLGLIVGLIVGSLKGVQLGGSSRSTTLRYVNPWCMIGCIGVIGLSVIQAAPGEALTSTWWYGISGAIAMIAMLVPGVSGSMMLVLLGTYGDVIQLIKSADVVAMLPFAFGALIGGGVSVKSVQWLIQKHSARFESFILGAIIGSTVYILNQVSWSESHPVGVMMALVMGYSVAKRLIHER